MWLTFTLLHFYTFSGDCLSFVLAPLPVTLLNVCCDDDNQHASLYCFLRSRLMPPFFRNMRTGSGQRWRFASRGR